MAGRKILVSVKQEDLERKRRAQRLKTGSAVEKFPLKETPFEPRTDEHAAALSRTPSPAGRRELIMRLHNTYGNRYVQRLLSSRVLQRQAVPGVAGFGNFVDLGNGLFGTTQPTDATEVSGLVNEIRTKGALAGLHQNIKVITGTHGDASGHLVGEQMFYTEDLAHEGHKVAEGGWINVLDVKGKSKETIGNWMVPGSSAVILAWCYSKVSQENWANVHNYKNEIDYQAGRAVW